MHERWIVAVWLCVVSAMAFAQAPAVSEPNINAYLSDVSGGEVSAGNIVGIDRSIIAQIQSSQDLVVALKPFATGNSKSGFGIAITPARTSIAPMASSEYYNHWYQRVLGSVTLSFAQDGETLDNVTYRKSGASIAAFYYLERDEDPVAIGMRAFGGCKNTSAKKALDDEFLAEVLKGTTKDDPVFAELQRKLEAAVKQCIDDALAKQSWNSSRISLAVGKGWIKAEGGAASESLGTSLLLGAILKVGQNGAAYLSYRATFDEVDKATLATSPTHRTSHLVAARYTYGSASDNGKWKFLAEVSNAKTNVVTETNAAFKYAIGFDRKLMDGTWLEFRLGKNQTSNGQSTETTGLMSIKFAPSTSLFAK